MEWIDSRRVSDNLRDRGIGLFNIWQSDGSHCRSLTPDILVALWVPALGASYGQRSYLPFFGHPGAHANAELF